MRFKKGSNVEVLRKTEVPSGSWWCAKIICRDGHKYIVEYDGVGDAYDETNVERVHRTAARPRPPSVEVTENWLPGDIVEVFDNCSWKMAIISEVLGNEYFLIRIVGSVRECKVGKLNVRVRQFWQDDKWVVVGKGSSQNDSDKQGAMPSLKAQKISFKKSHTRSSQNLKRGSRHLYEDETYGGATEKFLAVKREGRCHRVIAHNLSRLPKQADAALPSQMLGEKEIFSSLKNMKTVLFESVNLNSDDVDTITCSVGSCCIGSNDPYKSHHHVSFGSSGDFADQLCDAESFVTWDMRKKTVSFPQRKNWQLRFIG